MPPIGETPGIGYVPPAAARKEQLIRAQQLIIENCSDWPADEVDEVMLFLLDQGIEEEVAETTIVYLFAA